MALYTAAGALSVDVPSAVQVAELLSATAAYEDLTGLSGSDALATIVVGPGEPPWDGEAFTEEELAYRRAWCNVFNATDAGGSVFLGEGVNELNQQGVCQLEVHWKPAAAHLNDTNGAQDCYRYFWDRTSAIKNQLWAAVYGSATQCPRIQQIDEIGMGWTSDERETVEGAMLSCGLRVMWGDLGQ